MLLLAFWVDSAAVLQPCCATPNSPANHNKFCLLFREFDEPRKLQLPEPLLQIQPWSPVHSRRHLQIKRTWQFNFLLSLHLRAEASPCLLCAVG